MPFLAGTSKFFKPEVFTSDKLLMPAVSRLRHLCGPGKAVNPFYAKSLNLKFRCPQRLPPGSAGPGRGAILTSR
jgi:hypothetical protein